LSRPPARSPSKLHLVSTLLIQSPPIRMHELRLPLLIFLSPLAVSNLSRTQQVRYTQNFV
jgi:hypothetical protein